MLISSFAKTTNAGTFKVEVHQVSSGYKMNLHDNSGKIIRSQDYMKEDLSTIGPIAESWLDGIQQLNG